MSTYIHFGVMLDCSRNAVMKVSEVKRMIDCLQKMGYNTLELYTEDTYEIAGEPYFGYLRGRYTGAELKEIDAYAKAHGIELIPCVQTLAHLNGIVRHPVYQDIVDVNDILMIDEPKTYALIEKIFQTLAENFTSRLVNIGMDEAHLVGLGEYLKKHGDQDRYQLLLGHLKKVVAIADKYGFKPHMWSDMFFRLMGAAYETQTRETKIADEVLAETPETIELAYWDYYSPEKEHYDMQFKVHSAFKRKIWFAGGAWSWDGFAPLNWFSVQTMKPAMQSVRENGIQDVLITMWGDNGKECSFFSLLPSLYAIRQYADGNFDEDKIAKGFYKLFKIPYADFLVLDLPNRAETPVLNEKGVPVVQNPCKSLLYNDPFMGFLDNAVLNARPLPYTRYAEQLGKIARRAGEYGYLFDSLSKLCDLLSVKSELGVKTRRAYQGNDKKTLASLLKDYALCEKKLAVFHKAFCALWHKENKPHGWEIQDARLGGLMQRIKTCRERLSLYLKGKIERIEELEEEILPYDPQWVFQFNQYAQNVSMSRL